VNFWRSQRGQSLAYGILATALLILAVGAIYDIATVYHYRTWGYQAAGEAARYGALKGANLDYATGDIYLDPVVADQQADDFMAEALVRKGISDHSILTQSITSPSGGMVTGFPPNPAASLDGSDMHLDGPGVGVYVEFSVPTAWLGLINRQAYLVHVFSAAEAVEVVP